MKIDLEKWEKKFRDAGLKVLSVHPDGTLKRRTLAVGQLEFASISSKNSILIYPNDIEDDERAAALPLLHELLDEYLKSKPEPEPKYHWRLKIIKEQGISFLNKNADGVYFSTKINLEEKRTTFTRAEFEKLIPECMWDQFEAEEVDK